MEFKAGSGRQPTDETLQEALLRRFNELPGHDNQLDIVVRHGDVSLNGIVEDRYVKYLVEEILLTTQGVRDVRNHLRVRDPYGHAYGSPDEEHAKVQRLRQKMRGQHVRGS